MRYFIVGLVMVLGMYAQPLKDGDPGYQLAFGKAYWLAQPPAVRELSCGAPSPIVANQSVCPAPNAEAIALELIPYGFVIDHHIMIWGMDPYLTMKLRKEYGYTWVPSALQPPVVVAPGLEVPGMPVYDPAKPPPGSIKVSVDIRDFPAFDPPPPVPPAPKSFVGAFNFGNMYQVLPGDLAKHGDVVVEPRGTFKKIILQTPFGSQQYYEKQ